MRRALVKREAERQTDFVKLWWIVTDEHPAAAFAGGPGRHKSEQGALAARRHPRLGVGDRALRGRVGNRHPRPQRVR